jgi:hypothetical protein
MGRTVLGSTLACVVFLWGTAVFAQEAVGNAPPRATPAPAAPATEPPPLDPPPPSPPTQRPSFLKTEAEMKREGRGRHGATTQPPPKSFVATATPFVDFTLTSFYLNERVGNFLNLGAQFGGYAFERLRITGRLVTPLENVTDSYNEYGSSFNGVTFVSRILSRSMSLLYGVSVGLVISNSRSFVFGPSLELLRTDVEDYGTTVMLGLPFEWTTGKNMRVGFELAFGHSFGGSQRAKCALGGASVPCSGASEIERPGGTGILFQFYMGWALGRL